MVHCFSFHRNKKTKKRKWSEKKMAQAIRNKDVRKNCVDVERVIMDFLSESERKDILDIEEPVQTIKLKKEVVKLLSNYNAKYHQELIPINQIDQRVIYRNYLLNI
jgi:hypothetical protein